VQRGASSSGDAAELAGDDAGEVGHLVADQEIGLPAREIGQHVARHQLELDALQVVPQPRQVERQESGHGLAGREPHRAMGGIGAEPGAAPVDRVRRLFHGLGVGQQPLAGGGQREAVGQAVEQAGADGALQRPDPARDGRMADLEPARRRCQVAFAGQGEEDPEIVPVRRHDRRSG
jgi:hypothetical protein